MDICGKWVRSSRKTRLSMRSAVVGSAAVTVAERGLSARMPISPTSALRPSSATWISPPDESRETVARPSSTT
jgi:hypothetical protein